MLILLLGVPAVIGFVVTFRATGFRSLAKRIAVLVAGALIWWIFMIFATQLVAEDYHKDVAVGAVLILNAFIGGGVLGAVVRLIALLMQVYREQL